MDSATLISTSHKNMDAEKEETSTVFVIPFINSSKVSTPGESITYNRSLRIEDRGDNIMHDCMTQMSNIKHRGLQKWEEDFFNRKESFMLNPHLFYGRGDLTPTIL